MYKGKQKQTIKVAQLDDGTLVEYDAWYLTLAVLLLIC